MVGYVHSLLWRVFSFLCDAQLTSHIVPTHTLTHHTHTHTLSPSQAIWEWGDGEKREWQPFERDTNIQIEEMYDSGSQWAELTLCLPSPMPFLLDLHDMKLVNFRTAVRFNLRRIDQVPCESCDGHVILVW